MDMIPEPPDSGERSPGECFATTRWTRVLASHGNSEQARQALGDLCAAYYEPVVAFLRGDGRDEDTARDLAHEFFARVLEGRSFDGADPRRGRFRSYLLGALKHFLANHRARAFREKRGGSAVHEALEPDSDASVAAGLADPSMVPTDTRFDREWALKVIERAFAVLKRQCEENGTLREFERLKPWLTGAGADGSQAEAARELGMSEGGLRVAIHRLRRRFREAVRAEIAQTVDDPDAVADEMRHLIASLAAC